MTTNIKYPPGCQPELECLIHSSTVRSVCRVCADHLLIFVTNTGSPQPLSGGEGVNNLPLAPCLYFAALSQTWLVTRGSGKGPWTCLCQPWSKLCVTPVATNIFDWLGDNTYIIMFRQSKEIMTFLQNLRMRWRLSSKHGWVWPRVTQLGHRWVSECLTISLAGVTGPLARFLQYQAIKPSNTFLMHIRKPFSPENWN